MTESSSKNWMCKEYKKDKNDFSAEFYFLIAQQDRLFHSANSILYWILKINELKFLFSKFIPLDSATLKIHKEAFKETSYVSTVYSDFLPEIYFFSPSESFFLFFLLISHQ